MVLGTTPPPPHAPPWFGRDGRRCYAVVWTWIGCLVIPSGTWLSQPEAREPSLHPGEEQDHPQLLAEERATRLSFQVEGGSEVPFGEGLNSFRALWQRWQLPGQMPDAKLGQAFRIFAPKAPHLASVLCLSIRRGGVFCALWGFGALSQNDETPP